MTATCYTYGVSMLNNALTTIARVHTFHEGLYDAYIEGLQWLDGLGELPPIAELAIKDIINDMSRQPGSDQLERVRATVATLDEERARSLVVRLILLRWATVGETEEVPKYVVPRIPSPPVNAAIH